MPMTRLWSFLESLFREAKSAADYKSELLLYVTRHYSEHEADKVSANIQRMSPQALRSYLESEYFDSGMNNIVGKMIDAGTSKHPDKAGTRKHNEPRPSYSTSSSSTDKGSGEAEPIPDRPGRGEVDSPLHSRPTSVVTPGEKPTHAVGSAGQHQPKSQPSQVAGIVPQKMQPGQTRSGLVGAQKEVDRLTAMGKQKEADALAKRVGVPTSAERTNDDGRVVVWSPDRVLRFMDVDRNPTAREPGATRSVNVGGQERDIPAGRTTSGRSEPSRVDLIKHGLLKRQAAGVIKPKFPGRFVGQTWSPHGQSYEKNTARPDQATGNFAYGKATVGPEKTGAKVVWDGEDWIPFDEFNSSKGVAQRAWKASQNPPTRGKHVGGTPVSTTSPESIPLSRREVPKSDDDFEDEDPTDPDIKT